MTALQMAALHGYEDITEFLLSKGADASFKVISFHHVINYISLRLCQFDVAYNCLRHYRVLDSSSTYYHAGFMSTSVISLERKSNDLYFLDLLHKS